MAEVGTDAAERAAFDQEVAETVELFRTFAGKVLALEPDPLVALRSIASWAEENLNLAEATGVLAVMSVHAFMREQLPTGGAKGER